MKKYITTLFCTLLASFSYSEELFSYTESGMPQIVGEITTTLSKDILRDKIKMFSLDLTQSGYNDDPTSGVITFRAMQQTKSSYNPFAGNRSELVTFTANITLSEDKVEYRLNDLVVTKNYVGYGASSKSLSLQSVMDQIKIAQKQIDQANSSSDISAKERKNIIKNAEGVIANNTVTLEKATVILSRLIEDLKYRCN